MEIDMYSSHVLYALGHMVYYVVLSHDSGIEFHSPSSQLPKHCKRALV